MNCRKVSRRLSAYIEGDLSPRDCNSLEGHLKTCASCRRKAADIRLIIETSGQLEQQKPGPYFVNRLLCAIEQQKKPREILSGWRYRLTLSSVAFVAAASVTFYVIGPPATMVATTGPETEIQAGFAPGIDTAVADHGFPVSEEALQRDMALTEKQTTDSLNTESEAILKTYVKPIPVSTKKSNKGDKVF
ncbi:MAG: hypothetical protein GY839_14015 [candidate division Zixibacteria bacterium]|nr:hypothetical protein [candidate division Zixibacteria bacterium]